MKEILKNLVETTTLPEDSYLDQDAEILEIFVEEIEEIFVELNALFPEWLSDPAHQENLKTIRRHFHTLKGSGRMVGAKSAGEIAWAVEDTLNRVLSGSIQLTPTIQQYAKAVLNIYQFTLYPKFKQVQELDVDLAQSCF
jgi:Chemotaxis protein histidine kinase and related kinases